jgi:hypothetical protein
MGAQRLEKGTSRKPHMNTSWAEQTGSKARLATTGLGRYPHALDILPSWGGDSNLILTLLVGVQIEVRGSQAG